MASEILKIRNWLKEEVKEVSEHLKSMSDEEIGKKFAYGKTNFTIDRFGDLQEAKIYGFLKPHIIITLEECGDLKVEVSAAHHEVGAMKETEVLHNVAAFEYLEDFYAERVEEWYDGKY